VKKAPGTDLFFLFFILGRTRRTIGKGLNGVSPRPPATFLADQVSSAMSNEH
jgi:hypothetical protein